MNYRYFQLSAIGLLFLFFPIVVPCLFTLGCAGGGGGACRKAADCPSGQVCLMATPSAGGYCHALECTLDGVVPCPAGLVCINGGVCATEGTDAWQGGPDATIQPDASQPIFPGPVPDRTCDGGGSGEPVVELEYSISLGIYEDMLLGTYASYNFDLIAKTTGGRTPIAYEWKLGGKKYGTQILAIQKAWYAPYGEGFGNRGIATDGESLYVFDVKAKSIVKYDTDGKEKAKKAIKTSYKYWSGTDLTFDGTDLWLNADVISNDIGPTLFRISPSSGSVTQEIRLEFNSLSCLAWDGQSLWTADDKGLVRLTESGGVAERIAIQGYEGKYYIGALAWTGSEFLVLEGGSIYTVSKTGVAGEKFESPGDCSGDGLAVLNGLLWFSDRCSGLIAGTVPSRRGTPRIIASVSNYDFKDKPSFEVSVHAIDCEDSTSDKTRTFTASQAKSEGKKFSSSTTTGTCKLSQCTKEGFAYSCASSSSTTNFSYGGPGPNGVSSYSVTYSNGHRVTCHYWSSYSGSCSDDTGSTCSF